MPTRNQERQTPQYVFDYLNDSFGPFDLDPASSHENAKCYAHFTPEEDGLARLWLGGVFCNPPWNNIYPWVAKAIEEVKICRVSRCVMLLPARTDQKWYHELVMQEASAVYFIRGRINYDLPGVKSPGAFEPSIVVVFEQHPAEQRPFYGRMEIMKP